MASCCQMPDMHQPQISLVSWWGLHTQMSTVRCCRHHSCTAATFSASRLTQKRMPSSRIAELHADE